MKTRYVERPALGTVMVTMQDDALWLARELRGSGALLAAGGPLPTVYPSFFLDHFDAAAVGEGDETLSFASSLPLDYLSFSVPYPIPGTALYERVKARVNKNWTMPDGLFSDHVLTFDADFSEFKMKFAILKGNLQFKLRQRSGRGLSVLAGPFEKVSNGLFRILK